MPDAEDSPPEVPSTGSLRRFDHRIPAAEPVGRSGATATVLQGWLEIEEAVHLTAEDVGRVRERDFGQLVKRLLADRVLSAETVSSIYEARALRNRVMHGVKVEPAEAMLYLASSTRIVNDILSEAEEAKVRGRL